MEVRPLRVVLFLAWFTVFSIWAAPPASADEKASLENVLLIEQLVDVATTQQLLHSGSCGPETPVLDGARGRIGSVRLCSVGRESDPLARPFVTSALVNAGAALALNGLVRLAFRRLEPRNMRWLRLGLVLYPTVIVGNVASTLEASRFSPTVTLSLRR
jgi:hypothetical protein